MSKNGGIILRWLFYIFSDPEIPEHKVDIEQPIPDHKFVYKDHEVQKLAPT